MLLKAPELLKIFFLGSAVSLDYTDLTADAFSIRAHVHQQFVQGIQTLWPGPAQTGHIRVALAWAAVKTATCDTELQQAFWGYPLHTLCLWYVTFTLKYLFRTALKTDLLTENECSGAFMVLQ